MKTDIIKAVGKIVIPLAAIAGIVLIELKAMALGMNGLLLSLTVAALAGIGGFEVKQIKDMLSKK